VDDSAYTNVMAQWNLERGAEVVRLLRRRWPRAFADLSRRLGLVRDEPEEWTRIASRLYTGLDPRTGLFEQFRGYFQLEDPSRIPELADRWPAAGGAVRPGGEPGPDPDAGAGAGARSVPAEVLLGRERVQRSQIVKQADVVMLLHLLWDRFSPRVREVNFRYYEPRTDHASSLSPPVHAAVAARLGDVALAERYFRQTAEIDLANNMGNAAGGVHAAALGGLWQAAVFGFAGLRLTAAGPVLEPHLPPAWGHLRFAVRWQGKRVALQARAGEAVAARVAPAAEVGP
jgi:kojibiose phosphorylase